MPIMRVLIVVLVSSVLVSCGTSSRSSTDASQTATMTGAYAAANIDDSDVVSCANYAVETREPKGTVRLVKVLSAEKQVVAGMNLKMKLSILSNGVPKTVNVVVWSKLDGTKEVTEWE